MALKNVYIRNKSNAGVQSYIYVNSGDTITLNSMNTVDCVDNPCLYVRFYDTSTISIIKELSLDGSNWCMPVLPQPPVLAPTIPPSYLLTVVSAITATNSWINLTTPTSNNIVQAEKLFVAPYTRIKITAHRSCAKLDIYYGMQVEEGGW